jgi:uncharacterized protein (DUF362 family)
MKDIFMNVRTDAVYPTSHSNYNPDLAYPEYLWSASDISTEKNSIYEMVRDCLIGLGMDVSNVNKKEWNPLGEIIKEGDTVLIKPNWVLHYNKNKNVKENSFECLITHPSILRAVTDYCLIALKGTGKIIIGDSPMQGCDLDNLIFKSGYQELFDFYNFRSINVHPTDFRHYSTLLNKNKVLIGRKYNTSESIDVDLKTKSNFYSDIPIEKTYKVSDYNYRITNRFHNGNKHNYQINKDVLSADVIINLCKPKCHRLAGMTAALKNFVGITFDKACLPHRTVGSKQQGGDEYLNNSSIKRMIGIILNKKIVFEEEKKTSLSLIMRYLYTFLYFLMKSTSKDKFLIGSWYGNDTIWRTILDLYYILLYADKHGIVQNNKQRVVFNIADMIISGEGNGPVSPEPKKLGIIVAGSDAVMFDRLVCEIMGFDSFKIPTIRNSIDNSELIDKKLEEYLIYSNINAYNEKRINDLNFPKKWNFKPYNTWKGYIEKSEDHH